MSLCSPRSLPPMPLMFFTCPCQEFVGSTHCKASGSNTKTLVLKVGQWKALGSYKYHSKIHSELGSWKWSSRRIFYIYVRLGTPQQCASASNANEVTLKEGKSCVLLDRRCTCWPWHARALAAALC